MTIAVDLGRKATKQTKQISFKLLWKSLLPTNEEIHSKMKVLDKSQQISHCKSMQIFYDAQGKFTPQSKVGSTLN